MTTAVAGDVLATADRAEFAAYADIWGAATPAAARDLGLFSARVGPYTVLGCRAAPHAPMLNRVLGAGLTLLSEAALAEAVELLHGHGCVCQVALRDDGTDAAETRARLAARGFADGYAWMRFLLPPGAAPRPASSPHARTRVCGPEDAETFGATFAAGYELPPPFAGVAAGLVGRSDWTCVIAEAPDGTPMGTGALWMDDGVAWLGMGATVPAMRGRGAQGAVLAARIRLAWDAGCHTVTTETGARASGAPEASYRNILRAGFTEAGARPNLVAPPPA
ncbi:MAG: hypothetical protein U0Y82_02555 [Thermoleophilia bacterium]